MRSSHSSPARVIYVAVTRLMQQRSAARPKAGSGCSRTSRFGEETSAEHFLAGLMKASLCVLHVTARVGSCRGVSSPEGRTKLRRTGGIRIAFPR